jgi:hydroxymethylpyrimidine/phosphomethylpyrimidine kinase
VGIDNRVARDYLFMGDELTTFDAEFIETTATHGTGCVLSAAIAANLALENDLAISVRIAKDFVTEAIRTAPHLGKGNSPINI